MQVHWSESPQPNLYEDRIAKLSEFTEKIGVSEDNKKKEANNIQGLPTKYPAYSSTKPYRSGGNGIFIELKKITSKHLPLRNYIQ